MNACEAATRGLPLAFEEVFREHADFVYRTARRVLGNAEDAEDVLQTVFVRLLRREQLPLFTENPKAYLYRATVNTALNLIRSRRRDARTDSLETAAIQHSWRRCRADDAAREEFHAVLAELNSRTVEIIVLRYVHGYSDLEIAKLLRVSRGTIAVTLFRARVRLRKLFRGREEESL